MKQSPEDFKGQVIDLRRKIIAKASERYPKDSFDVMIELRQDRIKITLISLKERDLLRRVITISVALKVLEQSLKILVPGVWGELNRLLIERRQSVVLKV